MYRDRLLEIKSEKGISTKQWSEESGVSVETIKRITNPKHPDKDSPCVNTLEALCKPLGVELWELFYIGDKSFVATQAELTAIRAERDELLATKAVLEDHVQSLTAKVDELKDEVIETHRYYMGRKTSGVFNVD